METPFSVISKFIATEAEKSGEYGAIPLTMESYVAAAIKWLIIDDAGRKFLSSDECDSTSKLEYDDALSLMFEIANKTADWENIYKTLMAQATHGGLKDAEKYRNVMSTLNEKVSNAGLVQVSVIMCLKSIILESETIRNILNKDYNYEIMRVAWDVSWTFRPKTKKRVENPQEKAGEKEQKVESSGEKAETQHEKKPDHGAMAMVSSKVNTIREYLTSRLFGQDKAIDVVMTGCFRAEMHEASGEERKKPRATFLFAGPPGVGKTYMAECMAKVLDLPFLRVDMSEYSEDESVIMFCGSDPVYRSSKPGVVTGFVKDNPRCVLLFDEIEKAHLNIIHLFLQMLDAGRLRDNYYNAEVPFTNANIFITTNAGRQLYDGHETGDLSDVSLKVILKALEKDVNPVNSKPFFPPAICSRFASGNVVMFNKMKAHDLLKIARREIENRVNIINEQFGFETTIDEALYAALLFSEGGNLDARTIKARTEVFLLDEYYELIRLVTAENENKDDAVDKMKKVAVKVRVPKDAPEISGLFRRSSKTKVLIFASDEVVEKCREAAPWCDIVTEKEVDDAAKRVEMFNISTVIIDPEYGVYDKNDDRINIADIESKARDLFYRLRSAGNVGLYFVTNPDSKINDEEKRSMLTLGAQGFITPPKKDKVAFSDELDDICDEVHQQDCAKRLARANKRLSFDTAQYISDDGTEAVIELYDFKLETCIDAEDSENVMSSMSTPNICFNDVIGAEDAKNELRSFTDYMKNPWAYLSTGVNVPRGILLYGPPGTGKTMLAKAMAGESGATFLSIEGNQFLKKFVGEGPAEVHKVFRIARKYAPTVLFVDEIDAIARDRSGDDTTKSADVLNAFLNEMDGFKTDTSKPVFVLAATNFTPEQGTSKSLDPALMRRFDRRIHIDLPTREDRLKYLQGRIKKNPNLQLTDEQLNNIVLRSTGMSLADLESIIDLSLRNAIRGGGSTVTDALFDEAFETFTCGEQKKWDESLLERVARHEAGHALVCRSTGKKPTYLTVVARGDMGGYMQHVEDEGKLVYTRDELLGRIRTSLGGRAAEIVYYGENDGISTSASGDLQNATSVAREMICRYGMSSSLGMTTIDQRSLESGSLSDRVRDEINAILEKEMENAVRIITAEKDKIDRLVNALMSKNHLTGDEIEEILG